MKQTQLVLIAGLLSSVAFGAVAGPLDPECTAEKAAKSAAAKATVGVSGRCTPAEAAKDSVEGVTDNAKDAVGDALPDNKVADKAVDAIKPEDDKGALKKATKKVIE